MQNKKFRRITPLAPAATASQSTPPKREQKMLENRLHTQAGISPARPR
ncbi:MULTISPECIES: hypothetical protein [Kingella]|uniref:Uncharacterized protein n=1 Tax=Kingella bonacorsii TaxID=2796361 RepID=A0ABS1BV52_9NEIS|nr:hypothetical protein [Kingella bonacorsii]MBK0397172.1 hypothetical protein [Kingella bonacorsii]